MLLSGRAGEDWCISDGVEVVMLDHSAVGDYANVECCGMWYTLAAQISELQSHQPQTLKKPPMFYPPKKYRLITKKRPPRNQEKKTQITRNSGGHPTEKELKTLL